MQIVSQVKEIGEQKMKLPATVKVKIQQRRRNISIIYTTLMAQVTTEGL